MKNFLVQRGEKMNEKERKAIGKVISYPKKGMPRRSKDGYPLEVVYDEFAYKRMVDSYRDALKEILRVK